MLKSIFIVSHKLYSDLLDEIDRTVVSIENNENIQRQSSAETEISTDLDDENTVLDLDDDDDDSEYKVERTILGINKKN